MKKYYFLFLLILLAPAFAEVSECVNNSVSACPSGVALRNLTIVTGAQGATVLSCNADADCVDTGWFKCFKDWDGVGPSSASAGWCNATAITSCYSNGTAYVNNYYFCTTSTAYRQCSSGAWASSDTSCTGNQTCTSGTASPCATSNASSGGGGSGGTGSNATPTPTPTPSTKGSISITSSITDFDLVQEESVIKSLTAKNDGNLTLNNTMITTPLGGLSDSGVTFNISPDKFSNLSVGSSATFILNFSASANATVKSYTVTTEVTSSDAKTSATFTLRVLPSNATVENTILPLYDSLKLQLAALKLSVTELEKQGINTTAMKRLLADIEDKLNQTSSNIEKKDYFAAAQLLDSAKALIAELQSSISQAKAPGIDFLLILIIVVVIAGIGAFIYLMWPSEEGFSPQKGWKPEKDDSIVNKILEKIKRKKKPYDGR